MNGCPRDSYNEPDIILTGEFMNHVLIRKLALSVASVSLGTVVALALLCGVVYSEEAVHCIKTESVSVKASVDASISAVEEGEYPISCTDLVIRNLASYDGAFYEDGSGREVMNVAALMVSNVGQRTIPYAYITVDTADAHYEFDATMLPPGTSVLIPEKNASILTSTKIVDYFGWNTVKRSEINPSIIVEELEDGRLKVKNDSDDEVKGLNLYYRTYIEDGEFYMGGRAHVAEIPSVNPGETVFMIPDYYVSGYSEIVYIE